MYSSNNNIFDDVEPVHVRFITIDYNHLIDDHPKILMAFLQKNISEGKLISKVGQYEFNYLNENIFLALKNNLVLIKKQISYDIFCADIIDFDAKSFANMPKTQKKIFNRFLQQKVNEKTKILEKGEYSHFDENQQKCYILNLKIDLVYRRKQNDRYSWTAKKFITINEQFTLNENDSKLFKAFLENQREKNNSIIMKGHFYFNKVILKLETDLIAYPTKKDPNKIKYAVLPNEIFDSGGSGNCYISPQTFSIHDTTLNGTTFELKQKKLEKTRLIKVLRPESIHLSPAFIYEHDILKLISKGGDGDNDRHVKEIAANYDEKGKVTACALTMRCYQANSLFKYLEKDRNNNFQDLNINDRIKLIIKILKAYKKQFIEKNLIHGDLKLENILVTIKEGDIIFIDLATARNIKKNNDNSFFVPLVNFFTADYAPFESIKYDIYNDKSDAFCLSMILRLILGIKLPFINIPEDRKAENALDKIKEIRQTMTLTSEINPSLLSVLSKNHEYLISENLSLNYSFDPEKRPTFETTLNLYEKILNERVCEKSLGVNNNKQKRNHDETFFASKKRKNTNDPKYVRTLPKAYSK